MAYLEMDNLTDRHNVLIYNWSRSLKGPKPVYQWGTNAHRGSEGRVLKEVVSRQ